MKPVTPLFLLIFGFVCLMLLADQANRMHQVGHDRLDSSEEMIELEVKGPPCADARYPMIGRWHIAHVCVERGVVTILNDQALSVERWNQYIKPVVDSLKTEDRNRNGWKSSW